MTIREILDSASARLRKAGVISPALDAQVLLAHALDTDRTGLLAWPDTRPSGEKRSRFENLLERRAAREPVAYIVGVKEFYSLDFIVDRSTLIPRPETEGVVDAALGLYGGDTALRAIDMGSGSGALAVTLAVKRPLWRVVAADISAGAVEITRKNAAAHDVRDRVEPVVSDLFGSVPPGKFDLIVSNPPYIMDGDGRVDIEASRYEPGGALFSGPTGLESFERIIAEGAMRQENGGRMILEMGDGQAGDVAAIFERGGEYAVERVTKDLAGLERVIVARKRG